jgi:hypothetical protein
MSINAYLGIEQSCRDDLEALLYVLIYFLRGDLPWQGLKTGISGEKYEGIRILKQTFRVEDLCDGSPGINMDRAL